MPPRRLPVAVNCGRGPLPDVIKGAFSMAKKAELSISPAIWAYQAHFSPLESEDSEL